MLVSFIDIETTGKFNPEHRIIEFSSRLCDLRTFEEISNTLIRFHPKRSIEAKALAVHKISLDDLKHEKPMEDKADELIKALTEPDLCVAHNGDGFDFPFIEMELKRLSKEYPVKKTFDTMKMGTFATDLGKMPSLSELCWSLDIDYDAESAHKGDYDTLVLRDAFFSGLKLGWFKLDFSFGV